MSAVVDLLKKGGGIRRSPQAIANVADELGVEQDSLSAFVEVEAAGSGFDSKGRIKLLFEKHHFWKHLSVDERKVAQSQGLARPNWISPKNGGYRDQPNNDAALGLLERAVAIDEEAALKSASWGAGQVMGSHYKSLDYPSVQDFVTGMAKSEEEQIRVMGKFLKENGLVDEMKRKDWRALAKGYNGTGQVDVYAPRLARAYAKHAKLPDIPPASPGEKPVPPEPVGILRRGMQGEAVAAMQKRLVELGYPIEPDGDFGRATENAVKEFQGKNKLTADGIAGPMTLTAMKQEAPVVAVAVEVDDDPDDAAEQKLLDTEGITAVA